MSGRAEAEALAARIRAYWATRGKAPSVWVVQEYATASGTDERLHWVVRSNMVRGWPMAGPCQSPPTTVPRFNSGANLTPPNAIARLPGVPDAGILIESVRASNRVWREVRVHG